MSTARGVTSADPVRILLYNPVGVHFEPLWSDQKSSLDKSSEDQVVVDEIDDRFAKIANDRFAKICKPMKMTSQRDWCARSEEWSTQDEKRNISASVTNGVVDKVTVSGHVRWARV